ncbi:MAG: HAD family phosphatase [Candidatus Latescibacterota bacterium]|nr:MAG: HAD family phosphatase [Candidatus Latescibacterota bacterium]
MDKLTRLRKLLDDARAFVFDFDGLLADSERFHFLAYNEVFEKFGHRIDETEYYKYWTSLGHGVKGEIERHGLDLDPLAIRREKVPIFTRFCEDGSIPIRDEAKEMLALLTKTGKTMTIASGSSSGDIRAVLRNSGYENSFEIVMGNDTVPKLKPAPDVFLLTAELLELLPHECLVFEDAEKGVSAANDAGMPVVVIRTPETSAIDFDGADLTFDSHAEIVDSLKAVLSETG